MPDLIERFTEGDCHVLAAAISERTGWPIATFVSKWTGQPDMHAFVIHPSGDPFDIKGRQSWDEFREEWGQASVKIWSSVAEMVEGDDAWDPSDLTWADTADIVGSTARRLIAEAV